MPNRPATVITAALLLAGCDATPRSADRAAQSAPPDSAQPAAEAARQQAVREVVGRFGERLRDVSLLAPDSIVTAALRQAYGALVTPALLATWVAHPDSAPGRRVSSPWPGRIRIDSLRPAGAERVVVTGAVLYATSVERAQGGSAATAPVRLEVSRGADGEWRISDYAEDAGSAAAGGG